MKNKGLLFTSLMVVTLLVSCGDNQSIVASVLSSETGSSQAASSEYTYNEKAYKYGPDIFQKYMAQEEDFTEALKGTQGKYFMPSIGNSKLLVVPVLFSDTTKTDSEKSEMQTELQKVFFGEASDTGWESVSSYYKKSSYGKLNIQGKVSECVTLPKTFANYNAKATANINIIVAQVYKDLFVNGTYKAEDYDNNGDGIVDGIYMVNEAPIDPKGQGLGWAFTTWYIKSILKYPIGAYSWSSIDFASRGNGYTVASPDAHTYIHEMGHVLGLNDYYDTFNSYNSVAGGANMQDFNICDHDPYSKYLWGWANPTVITEENTDASITVNLKPMEDSGDCVVLASKFNGSALDEYLLLEYYTPTGLNKKDAESKYESILGINGSGIRLWHCDKRVYQAYMDTANEQISYDPNEMDPVFAADLDTSTPVVDFATEIATNSSKNYSSNFMSHAELQMVRSTYGTDAYDITSAATAADLFKEGATFGTADDKFSDFAFYSTTTKLSYDCDEAEYKAATKAALPYSFKVESVGDTAKIVFTKKA
ncbi:MAG: hypothetical protein LKJ88_01295 [Bacilli bacterium]|jgi:M6 family metalloprotease-like protein|nr:hypothetical protein [Bacilli bacterium]